MRFDEFLSTQKESVKRLGMVVLLSKYNRTRGPVYVMDAKSFSIRLNELVFDKSVNAVMP